MSVTLMTSFARYPSERRNRASSEKTTNGRALPMWMRL